MKKTGSWVIFIGIMICIYAFFFFGITVTTGQGTEVVNLSLMDARRNMIIIGGIMAIVGAIFFVGGKERN